MRTQIKYFNREDAEFIFDERIFYEYEEAKKDCLSEEIRKRLQRRIEMNMS